MTVPDIHVKALSLGYGRPLFERLDLHLPAGRWTALLGTSGVGKSTLLRFIGGLLPEFRRQTRHIETSDGQPLARRISYMAQQDGLLPWLNVLNNLLLPFRLQKKRVDKSLRRQAETWLCRLGIGDTSRMFPDQLSGGMRQRAALARTLLQDKPVVLLDEPFSSLDAITRVKLQNLAARSLQGKTVLMVTHDPAEALRLADDVYVLSGTPAHLTPPMHIEQARDRTMETPEMASRQAQLLTLLDSGTAQC